MPWHPCIASRDSIAKADGLVVNHLDYGDADHTVTSYCRTIDGTWVAWKNAITGESVPDTSHDDAANVLAKSAWPADIANAFALSVGFFPDDASPPTVYDLAVDPCFSWRGVPLYSDFDPCSRVFPLGNQFSNASRSSLTRWFMNVLDVQIRTDGANVWVVILADEAVKYPFLADCGLSSVDRCGNPHPPIEFFYESDPFVQDTDSGFRYWKHYGSGTNGNDDNGLSGAFRWQPARVTVFAGDLGGFTRLDTVEAKFFNNGDFGLCGNIETCASPTDPGVVHVMWSEGGSFGSAASSIGQRVNYSRWDTSTKLIDTDLLYADEDNELDGIFSNFTHIFQGGVKYNSDDNWAWTAEYILRNDHGSPAAIVCPWPDSTGPGPAEYWDLSSGSTVVVQIMDPTLYPMVVEAGLSGSVVIDGELASGARRSQFASALYTDPLLTDQDVYLICLGFKDPTLDLTHGIGQVKAFYRIPCDGSASFDYMDGTRLPMFSIIPAGVLETFGSTDFGSDFVSDPGNVWMPATNSAGGQILHLPRTCERTWELLPAFPDADSGFEIGDWVIGAGPPSLVYDSAGDWIAGGGTGPITVRDAAFDTTNIASLRAKICRCCVPCIARIGLHIWEQH